MPLQLKIQIVMDEGKDSGIINIHKVVPEGTRKVGEMKFADEQDRKWLVMALTDGHPNVSAME